MTQTNPSAHGGTKTIYQAVWKMYLEEALPAGEIIKALTGRASIYTVRDYIQRACREAHVLGIEIPTRAPKRPGGFAIVDPKQPLSPVHKAIGLKLERARALVNENATEFCERHSFANHIRLHQMELGHHDFTLAELQKISEITSLNVSSLMEVPSPYVPCNKR